VKYIALEEAFSIPGIADPMSQLSSRATHYAEEWLRMFSIDYPYESSLEAVEGFERATLSPGDREKIAHANAERILKI
jgi:2,3-dihydroxybenzoate decarboxylase